MIDWLSANQTAVELLAHPVRTKTTLADAVAAAQCFQNTEFPLSPLPLYASAAETSTRVSDLEGYVALLGRIVSLYREHREVRAWYGLGPAAEALIAADIQLGDVVPVCRLDGYLEQTTERLVLLENNADAPAGTLFSARVNTVVLDALARAGIPVPRAAEHTMSGETVLLDVLLKLLADAGLPTGDPRVAVLQFAGAANRESLEMAAAFQRAGVHTVVVDPRDLRRSGDQVLFGDHPIDVCWNKVNTVGWRTMVEADPDLVARWATVLADGLFVHVNPFGSRYIAESKLTLALPRQPGFAELFTPEEHALVDRLLPWARRLTPDARAPDGRPLAADVRDRPNEYVLKQPYDIRGDGVTVGRAATRADWDRAVDLALAERLVAQRYVAPTAYPVVRAADRPAVVAMPVSFDTFVLGGRVHGFGSKASLNARLNVFQGGQKLAVHVCDEEPDD